MKEPSAKKLHLPYQHKATAILFLVLRFFVVLVMVRKLFLHEWESVFICVLTLFLFVLPSIASSILKITLPSVLEIIILLFIFSAEILGELNSFYIRIPHWDTMLHTINGCRLRPCGHAQPQQKIFPQAFPALSCHRRILLFHDHRGALGGL